MRTKNNLESYKNLPGCDLVFKVLKDSAGGKETNEALLGLIGSPRLRALDIPVPVGKSSNPEKKLMGRLSRSNSDSAHSRYNALIRRLVSFERAAECANR